MNPLYIEDWLTAGALPLDGGDLFHVGPTESAAAIAEGRSVLLVGGVHLLGNIRPVSGQQIVTASDSTITPFRFVSQVFNIDSKQDVLIDVKITEGEPVQRIIWANNVRNSRLTVDARWSIKQAAIYLQDVAYCDINATVIGATEFGDGGRGYGITTSSGVHHNRIGGYFRELRHHLPLQNGARYNVINADAMGHRHPNFQNGGPAALFHGVAIRNLVTGRYERIDICDNGGPADENTIANVETVGPLAIRKGSARNNLLGVEVSGSHNALMDTWMEPIGLPTTPTLIERRAYWTDPNHDPYQDSSLGPGVWVHSDAGPDNYRGDIPDELWDSGLLGERPPKDDPVTDINPLSTFNQAETLTANLRVAVFDAQALTDALKDSGVPPVVTTPPTPPTAPGDELEPSTPILETPMTTVLADFVPTLVSPASIAANWFWNGSPTPVVADLTGFQLMTGLDPAPVIPSYGHLLIVAGQPWTDRPTLVHRVDIIPPGVVTPDPVPDPVFELVGGMSYGNGPRTLIDVTGTHNRVLMVSAVANGWSDPGTRTAANFSHDSETSPQFDLRLEPNFSGTAVIGAERHVQSAFIVTTGSDLSVGNFKSGTSTTAEAVAPPGDGECMIVVAVGGGTTLAGPVVAAGWTKIGSTGPGWVSVFAAKGHATEGETIQVPLSESDAWSAFIVRNV